MAIKDLMKATEADRYTADGRDELNEALKADVEDRTYKTFEISEKTGLQKQPDGSWAPPKKGGASTGRNLGTKKVSRGPGAIVTPGKGSIGMEEMKEAAEKGLKGQELKEFMMGKKNESKPTEEKTERYNYRAALEKGPKDAFAFEGTVTHSIPMSQEDHEELDKLSSFMKEENATYKNALISRASNLVDGNKNNGDWYPEKEQSIMKIAKAVGFDDELHKFIEEEYKGYDFGYSEDAAPRQLTGDCKIRVRKA